MNSTPRVDISQKYIICVDSYDNKIITGYCYNSAWERYAFSGAISLLQKMESWMDEERPQAYTKQRTLAELMPPEPLSEFTNSLSRGRLATYDVQIIFRQHSSWQGIMKWYATDQTVSFRSVLELITLIDSSLRGLG